MLRHAFLQYSRILAIGAGIFAGVVTATQQASAAQEIVLTADQSKVMTLPVPPATIVVGNPAIADVTTDGNTLLFHPRAFGVTNVLALDGNGRRLADYVVRVIFDDSYSVTMYEPGIRETYTCRNNCETTIRIGDEKNYYELFTSQSQGKFDLATKQAGGGNSQSAPVVMTVAPTN